MRKLSTTNPVTLHNVLNLLTKPKEYFPTSLYSLKKTFLAFNQDSCPLTKPAMLSPMYILCCSKNIFMSIHEMMKTMIWQWEEYPSTVCVLMKVIIVFFVQRLSLVTVRRRSTRSLSSSHIKNYNVSLQSVIAWCTWHQLSTSEMISILGEENQVWIDYFILKYLYTCFKQDKHSVGILTERQCIGDV